MLEFEKDTRPPADNAPDGTAHPSGNGDGGQVMSLPVALRELPLLPEAAREMQRRLDDPIHRVHGGKPMPTVDAASLRGQGR